MKLRVGVDRLEAFEDGILFARYTFAGTRRPYFWPVIGPSGHSVVRGAGGVEHPHHTGLAINYGGHAEGGSSNIWSDWDQPPYGPGGRMLHVAWLSIDAESATEQLLYVDADGRSIVSEIRTIRFSWASYARRYIDLEVQVEYVADKGPRPFILMARASEKFDIPRTGRVSTEPGVVRSNQQDRARWIDASGPTGGPPPPPPSGPPELLVDLPGVMATETSAGDGPWNGVAILDHPSNSGYPNIIGKYAVAKQLTQAHYPPAAAPNGPFSFRTRVFVHDGDAKTGEVAAEADSYLRS